MSSKIAYALLFAVPLCADVSVDSTSNYGDYHQGTQMISWEHTVSASATLLLVTVSIQSTARVVHNVYAGGQFMKFVGRWDNSGSRLDLWKLEKPPVGTITIKAIFNTANVRASGGSVSFVGADGTLGDPVVGSGNAAPTYTLTVASAPGNLVFNAGVQVMGTRTCTERTITPVTQTTLWAGDDICNDAQFRHFAGYHAGDGSVNVQWTSSETASVGRIAIDVRAGTYTAPSRSQTWPYLLDDVFFSFENCIDGEAPTNECLAASASSSTGRTIGTFDTSLAAGKFTIKSAARCPLPEASSGLGLEFYQDASGTSAEIRYNLGTEAPHSYSWGACFRTSDQSMLGNQEGPHAIGFRGAAKLERISDEKNGPRVIRWGNGELGNNVPVQDATWYWLTGRRNVANGTLDLNVYTIPGLELVASVTSSYPAEETTRLNYIWFGVEALGTTPVGATYQIFIDSFVLNLSNGEWPLLPKSPPARIMFGGHIGVSGNVRTP